MFDSNAIDKLKQVDLAKEENKDKIMQRIKDIWKSLDKPKREEFFKQSGLKKYTVERTYKKGNLSAKLVVALSQFLKINPRYLTGESDSMEGFSNKILLKFVDDNSSEKPSRLSRAAKKEAALKDMLQEAETEEAEETEIAEVQDEEMQEEPQAAEAEEKAIEAPKTEPQQEDAKTSGFLHVQRKILSLSPEEIKKLEQMSKDEMITLVEGLLLRSKYSAEVNNIANMVKFLITI